MAKFVALLRAVNVGGTGKLSMADLKSHVFFLRDKPPRNATTNISHRIDEELRTGNREIYVHYPSGMGKSKLLIPAATSATARNMNTVAKLVEMSL